MRHLIALTLLATLAPTVAPAGPVFVAPRAAIVSRPAPVTRSTPVPPRPATPARANTDQASTGISGPGVGLSRPAPVAAPAVMPWYFFGFGASTSRDDSCQRGRDEKNPACQPLRK